MIKTAPGIGLDRKTGRLRRHLHLGGSLGTAGRRVVQTVKCLWKAPESPYIVSGRGAKPTVGDGGFPNAR